MAKTKEENKELIVIIPDKVNEQIKEAGLDEEFEDLISKLQKGELPGNEMTIEPCKKKLQCNECGSKNIIWNIDTNSKEVYYNCSDCGNCGWMYDWEYEKAIDKNPEMVIENGKDNN